MAVRFTDNSKQVLAQLEDNVSAALEAMGVKAVGAVVDQMQTGYVRPIWKTGDLQRDVNFEVERSGKDTVDIGNSLDYASYVHDGTHKMGGRPYLSDGIMKNADEIFAVGQAYLKKGF